MESVNSYSSLFPESSQASVQQTKGSNELGQEDFMRLMVAQLENQDPTKPMDNFQFLSQIAQFGSLNAAQDLNNSFGELSSSLYAGQALQAATLVGKSVVTGSNLGVLSEGEPLSATVELPSPASEVNVYVQDMSGRLVYSEKLGPSDAGDVEFQWLGSDTDGGQVAPGQYRISAEAVVNGVTGGVSAYAHQSVESVSLSGSAGVTLNLAGGKKVGLAEVNRFL